MTVIILGITAAFLFVWLVSYSISKRKSANTRVKSAIFSLPVPKVDRSRLENFGTDLVELGFALQENLDKSSYGLWPSPVKLFAHKYVPSFAEVAVLPTDEIQIQFITLFPAGSVMTVAGERNVSLRFLTPRDVEAWEPGHLAVVWGQHQRRIKEYVMQHNRSPLPPTVDAYADFLNMLNHNIQDLLKEDKLIPRTITDYLLLGYLYLNAGRVMESLEMFQGAINLDPEKPALYRMAGKICLFVANFEACSQYLFEAVELDPLDKESYVLLSEALLLSNKKESALIVLKKAHASMPDDSDISFRLGKLATQLGDLDLAKSCLDPLEGTASPSSTLFQALADLYGKLGQTKRAKGYSRLARIFAKEKKYWAGLPWKQ